MLAVGHCPFEAMDLCHKVLQQRHGGGVLPPYASRSHPFAAKAPESSPVMVHDGSALWNGRAVFGFVFWVKSS